jgi:acyl-CoA synthetase (AMP-forming)/AMP-acid ligase II
MLNNTVFDPTDPHNSLLKILTNGATIKSSGTTGEQKTIFRTPENLKYIIRVALAAQEITNTSRILTVCKMEHAGGLLAQTLPGISIGAEVDIVSFNAYDFVKNIRNYTHSHLAPAHARAIMMTKGFKELDLSNIWITCGSDPVTNDIIEAFVDRGATFMANWGMSEVGPIVINSTFRSKKDLDLLRNDYAILGNNFYVNWKIIDDVLYIEGDQVYIDGWISTGDLVKLSSDIMYYVGRKDDSI